MTPDIHLKEGEANDFPPGSHEANIRRTAHKLRLLCGAEPSVSFVLAGDGPTQALRYQPYKQ